MGIRSKDEIGDLLRILNGGLVLWFEIKIGVDNWNLLMGDKVGVDLWDTN